MTFSFIFTIVIYYSKYINIFTIVIYDHEKMVFADEQTDED